MTAGNLSFPDHSPNTTLDGQNGEQDRRSSATPIPISPALKQKSTQCTKRVMDQDAEAVLQRDLDTPTTISKSQSLAKGAKRPRIQHQEHTDLALDTFAADPQVDSQLTGKLLALAREEAGSAVLGDISHTPQNPAISPIIDTHLSKEAPAQGAYGHEKNDIPISDKATGTETADADRQGPQRAAPSLLKMWLKATTIANEQMNKHMHQSLLELDQRFAEEMVKINRLRNEVGDVPSLCHDLDEEREKTAILEKVVHERDHDIQDLQNQVKHLRDQLNKRDAELKKAAKLWKEEHERALEEALKAKMEVEARCKSVLAIIETPFTS